MTKIFLFIYPIIGLFLGRILAQIGGRKAIAIVNACLYSLLAFKLSTDLSILLYSALFSVLILMASIDFDYMIIRDRVPLSILLIGIGLSFYSPIPIGARLLGFFFGGSILLISSLITKGGIGGGDIKLMASSGFALGLNNIFIALVIGIFFACAYGLLLVLIKKESLKMEIPLGPFLAIGIIFSVFLS